jgi:hypothetical protein
MVKIMGLLRILAVLSLLLATAPPPANLVSASPAPPRSANVVSVAVLSIQPASRLAVPGQVFTVTLAIDNAINAAAYETTISYDPHVLQVLSAAHS